MSGPLVEVSGECIIEIEGDVTVDIITFEPSEGGLQPLEPPQRFGKSGKYEIGKVDGFVQAVRVGTPGPEVSVFISTK